MDVFTVAILTSFALFIGIGIVMSRRVKTKADYFVAGRNVGVLLIVGTLVASYLSTVALMGEAGFAYDGFPWAILLLGAVAQLGYLIGVLLFGRYLREARTLTIPEFFGERFQSNRLRALSGLMVLVGIGLYLVAVTRGISIVLESVTGISGFWAILVTWAAFSLFTILSGSKGVIVTDLIMFFIFMVGGALGFFFIISSSGGFTEVFTALASDPETREGLMWYGTISAEGAALKSPLETLIYVATFGIVWMFVIAVSPWQASRYMMAKSNHVAVRAGLIALIIVPIFYVLMLFAAYAVNLTNSDIEPSENVLIWASYNIMPTAVGVIVVTGIMAAGLSSASTFLSLVGFSAVHDVAPLFRRKTVPKNSDDHGVRNSRVAMLIVGAAALIVTALATPGVLEVGYMAAAFFAASWGLVAFASTQSTRVTERGAFYGMLAGGAAVLLLESLATFGGLALPTVLDPVLIGLAASALGLLIGSLTTQPSPATLAYASDLKARVEVRADTREIKTTNRYFVVSIVVVLALFGAVAALYIPGMIQTP